MDKKVIDWKKQEEELLDAVEKKAYAEALRGDRDLIKWILDRRRRKKWARAREQERIM
jgi:hypothetical protein